MDEVIRKSISIKMDSVLLDYVDEFAKQNGVSRAGAINVIVSQHMHSQNSLKTLNELMVAYNKEQALKQLEDAQKTL